MLKHILPFFSILILAVFAACIPEPAIIPDTGGASSTVTSFVNPSVKTAVIQSLTAIMWTATYTPTPILDSQKLITVLNSEMVGADPLSETVEAKFYVMDIEYPIDEQSKEIRTIRIHVECEWIFRDNCTPEESFVNLMHVFISNDKMIEKVSPLVPSTLRDIQVITFNHMQQNGIIMVRWQDVIDYSAKRISGVQLGSRIVRLGP